MPGCAGITLITARRRSPIIWKMLMAGKSIGSGYKLKTDKKTGKTTLEKDHKAALAKLDVSTRLKKMGSNKVRYGKAAKI